MAVSARARAEPLATLPEPTLSPAESSQLRQLQLQLDDVREERAGNSTVLPWTVVALGVGAMLLGVGLGVERVGSCDESCSSPFWPSWMVIGGATVSTGGLIWLRLVEEDISELETRRYHLQTQIDGYEIMRRAPRDDAHALVQLGGRF